MWWLERSWEQRGEKRSLREEYLLSLTKKGFHKLHRVEKRWRLYILSLCLVNRTLLQGYGLRCSCSKRDVVTVKWHLGRLVC